jgi:acetyltransferase
MDEAAGLQSQRNKIAKIDSLLNPRNIVIAGASDKAGNWSPRILRNLMRYNYSGPIYPLNPARDEVWNRRCYRNFQQLPEPPDHILVLVPAPYVPQMLRDGAAAGARSATVITAGFSESTDPERKVLGEELRRVIEETGLAVSGPNCLGNFNASASLFTLPDDRQQQFTPGPVAIVAQSGGIVLALKRTLEERGIATGMLVTSGNETGLTAADYIAYYVQQPSVRVIVAYLEAIHDSKVFLLALQSARAAGKPVIIFKLGASEEGRAAAAAHTGALAGSVEAFDAVAGVAGAIRARNMDDLVETVEFLVHAPKPNGNRLAAITYSGGMRGLIVDAAAAHGLTFPALSDQSRELLQPFMQPGAIVNNPLDGGLGAAGGVDVFLKCVDTYLNDPNFDILLLQEELPREAGTRRAEMVLRKVNEMAGKANKPVAFISVLSYGVNEFARSVRAELPHLAIMQEPDRALRAIKNATNYYARMAEPLVPAHQRNSAGELILTELMPQFGQAALDEPSSKRLLSAYGIHGPKEALVQTADDAISAARSIGYPVVAKLVSSTITHKSDIGGVLLNLQTDDDVTKAFQHIQRLIINHPQKPVFEGVLIAQMVKGGIELVLGAACDPEMGPVLMFGSGGVTIELTKDVAFAPLPLNETTARNLISRTKVSSLIKGYRGQMPYDEQSLIKALIGLSQLASDCGDKLVSIDINPFTVQQSGGIALDALIILKK